PPSPTLFPYTTLFRSVHWDGLHEPFFAGMPRAYEDRNLEAFLRTNGVTLMTPRQYMDKWRLDRAGMRPIDNSAVKRALGFADVQDRKSTRLNSSHLVI